MTVTPAPEQAFVGKKVIRVRNIPNIQIEMPDQQSYGFGQNFQSRMITRLTQSDRFIVSPETPGATLVGQVQSLSEHLGAPGWSGSSIPAASLQVHVDALSFITGSRGERMFYGFNERMKTPFNDGSGKIADEFPLRSIAFEPNWFDRTFDSKGKEPFDSRSGLDLGDGFRLEALFAWLDVKYAQYQSQLDLMLEMRSPLSGKNEVKKIQVTGKGFFYDVAGAYTQYSAGIMVARRDAMEQAFSKAIEGALAAVEHSLAGLPLTARLDNIVPPQGATKSTQLLLGTGRDARVQEGTQYERVDQDGRLDSNSALIRITQSVIDGSVAEIVSGDSLSFKPGQIFRQAGIVPQPLPGPRSLAFEQSSQSVQELIDLPPENFKKPDFKNGQIARVSVITATLKALVETVFLPYRIWRYSKYDQPYSKTPRGGIGFKALGAGDTSPAKPSMTPVSSDLDPSLNESLTAAFAEPANQSDRFMEKEPSESPSLVLEKSRQDAWSNQIGFHSIEAQSAALNDSNSAANVLAIVPVVAIIDTGVDYNHPAIHSNLWINPSPIIDSRQMTDRYGWDFSSGDSRPFDDGYHGTQMASAVLSVAPSARIMPLKAFNAWGITRSASIYAAFQYAVDHGAQVIVCGWATRKPTLSIERGVEYARDHGVLVIAAAGDRGDDLEKVPAFPASLNAKYANVLAVASVDAQDHLVQEAGRFSNFSSLHVDLAAPGKDIRVAEPRNREAFETSTGVAAALVAGAAARLVQSGSANLKADLLQSAERIPALSPYIREGLRLKLPH